MTFHQFMTILWARRRIALEVLALAVLATLFVNLVVPQKFKARTTLVVNYKATEPVSGANTPAALMPGYMATQIDIIRSRNVALRVVDGLGLAKEPSALSAFDETTGGNGDIREWLAGVLLRNVSVKPSPESNTIDLTYEDEDPATAAVLANAFAGAYIQTNLLLDIEPSRRAAEWFSDQIKGLRDNLVKAQQRLADYQRDKGIVSLDERLDVESARLAELGNQLVLAQAQTFDSSSRQQQSYSGRRLDQLRTDLSSSRERESAIRSALERQKALVMRINEQRDKLGILRGDVSAAQKVLDMAMQRFSQTHMESQVNHGDVAVLDPATPAMEPGSPRLFVSLLVSVFVGTLLAAGIALLAEMRDRRIRAPEDLSIELGLPVLATVAAARGRRKFWKMRFLRRQPRWP